MSSTIQIRVDDELKMKSDQLFKDHELRYFATILPGFGGKNSIYSRNFAKSPGSK